MLTRRHVLISVATGVGSVLLLACGGPAAATTGTAVSKTGTAATTAASGATAAKTNSTVSVATAASVAAVAPSGAKVKLTYWFWGAPQEKASDEKLVAAYNAAHPDVAVAPIYVPGDYVTKFETAFAGNQGPDTFYINPTSGYQWSCSGLLLDQKPYLDRQHVDPKTKWHPIAQWWFQDKYVGTGISLEPILLYYNSDLFKQAGVAEPPHSPDTAWHWDAFLATAQKLTHAGSGGTATWGVLPGRTYQSLLALIYQTGSTPFGKNFEQSQLTDPAFTEPMQAIADLATKDKVAPMPSDLTGTTGIQEFMTGRIAMYVDGQWALQQLTDQPPSFDLRIGVIPVWQGAYFTGVGAPSAGVSARTPHTEQAVQFALSVVDNKQSLYNLQTGLWMGTTTDFLFGANRKLYVDDAAQHHPQYFVEAAIGSVNRTQQPFYKQFGAFHETWDLLIQPAFDPVFSGKATVKDAMTRITPQVDGALKKAAQNCAPTVDAAWLTINPGWGQ